MRLLLHTVILAGALILSACTAPTPAPEAAPIAASPIKAADSSSLKWSWQGDGNFPSGISLSLSTNPEGLTLVILDEWGALKNVDGWGELQRSRTVSFGTVRRVDGRNFIVLAERRQSAEFHIARDGVLQLHWFDLGSASPSDQDLLTDHPAASSASWPQEMKPSGAGNEAPLAPLPL